MANFGPLPDPILPTGFANWVVNVDADAEKKTGAQAKVDAHDGAAAPHAERFAPVKVVDAAFATATPAATLVHIQAKVDEVIAAGGGVVELPPVSGGFTVDGAINFREFRGGLIFRAQGWATDRDAATAARLTFSAATGSLFDLASCAGIVLEGLELRYSSTTYAGDLVKTGHGPSAVDPAYLTFRGCTFGALSGAGAGRSFVNLNRSIFVRLEQCVFHRGTRAIWGIDGASSYSNVVTIDSCVFQIQAAHPIYRPGQTWRIEGCAFEWTRDPDGKAGSLECVASEWARGLAYVGNWHGDVTTGGEPWIKNLAVLGAEISGNQFGTSDGLGATAVASATVSLAAETSGVSFTGNRVESSFVFDSQSSAGLFGFVVAGNSLALPAAGGVWRNGTPARLFESGNHYLDPSHDSPRSPAFGVAGTIEAALRDNTANRVILGEQHTATPVSTAAVVAYLDNVAGLALGSLGLFARPTSAFSEVALFAGGATTPAVRVANDKVGFYNTAPVAKPSLTYSRTGETTAEAQIRAALSALGLVTDSTTA